MTGCHLIYLVVYVYVYDVIAGAPGEGELAQVLCQPLLRYGRGRGHGARGAQPGQPRGVCWMLCAVHAMQCTAEK